MFSVRLTRNIQRLQHWSRFKSSTAAIIEVGADVKKLRTKKDETVDKTKVFGGKFSKQLFDSLKNTKINEDNAGLSKEANEMTKQANKQMSGDSLDQLIAKADKLNDLLAIADKPDLSRIHALKIVSTLAEWSSAGKVKPTDFENSGRFIRICSLLTTGSNATRTWGNNKTNPTVKSSEFEMILNVAGEDESAKVIQNLQLPQMVKVLAALALKRSRSLPLLRHLSHGISNSNEKLDLKQCSDVFYALTVLNYHDSVLMKRISMRIIELLQNNDNTKAAPVGSIVKSVGFLKFKDTELLDTLIKWTLQHQELYRPKDLASLCETLAIVNHRTVYVDEMKEKLLPSIVREDFGAAEWMYYVWSLSSLDLFTHAHLQSVLTPEFIRLLVADHGPALNITMKKKLLNINAVAQTQAADYYGPFLENEGSVYEIPFGYNKSKQTLVDGLFDTLENLFADQSLLERNIDTRMGFVIDAACVLDKNRNPVKEKSKMNQAFRIAFVVLDFHDVCYGTMNEPNGISSLVIKLLKHQGYTVLVIPHTEFNTSDTIMKRVQYLDAKLKNVVTGNV